MTANTSKNFSFISHTSSTRTLYIWMVESSMPIAIMLLSWGWNARKVAAGGGGMKVVIVCIQKKIQNSAPDLWVNVEIKKANFPIPWMSSYWTRRSFLQMLTSHKSHSWTKQSRKQLPHGLVRSHHLSLGCHLKVATIEVIHWLLPKQDYLTPQNHFFTKWRKAIISVCIYLSTGIAFISLPLPKQVNSIWC